MRKLALIILCVAVFSCLAAAQTYTQGSGITGIDKLGAHQNGGRGCTGCHAPHSGGRGGGGNAAANALAFNDPYSGDIALFGQDLTPLYGQALGFGNNGEFTENLPAALAAYSTEQQANLTGVAFCLACHDGNIAKGGMMTGISYEKQNNLLPVNVYGPNPIPTLLGNDGSTPGNYQNDHPVGPAANLGSVGVAKWFQWDAVNNKVVPNPAANNYSTQYGLFVTHYGTPSFTGRGAVVMPDGQTNPSLAYVVCTTCHTPHTMYIASASSSNPINGATTGNYPTYFFLVGPYNPGAPVANGTHASSATQFCRQCHFSGAGGANESVGITTVTTAF